MENVVVATPRASPSGAPFPSFIPIEEIDFDGMVCFDALRKTFGHTEILVWDVVIFGPNALFFIFLLLGVKVARMKLRSMTSLITSTFYMLIWLICLTSLSRTVMHIALPSQDTVDQLLWLLVRFLILMLEVCVLVFGLLFGNIVNTRRGKKITLAVTTLISLAYAVIQGVLEFETNWTLSHHHSHWDMYAHGGMIFLFVTSAIFTLVYLSIVIMPYTPLQHKWPLPVKRSFYAYAFFLCVVNLLQAIGSALVFYEYIAGLCLVDLTTLVYFCFFAPMVYFIFLRDFFALRLSDILFYNEMAVDNEHQSVNAGGYEHGYYGAAGMYDPFDHGSYPGTDDTIHSTGVISIGDGSEYSSSVGAHFSTSSLPHDHDPLLARHADGMSIDSSGVDRYGFNSGRVRLQGYGSMSS
eukprot:Opistho-2@35810